MLVPDFSKLSAEEVIQLLANYNISTFQLPVIFSKDPMVKEAGAKIGDVLKIRRQSNSGITYYFRVVVE